MHANNPKMAAKWEKEEKKMKKETKIKELIRNGADKVSLNTSAVKNQKLIKLLQI